MKTLLYPIGKLHLPKTITEEQKQEWISVLENFPNRLENLVHNLTNKQLDTPYRDEGWTIRQVVHHCADSHHHSYIRFKWAMTENNPTIKAYNEADWAELFDTKTSPIEISILHLKAVHAKLVNLLRGLSDDDLERTFYHPESKVEFVGTFIRSRRSCPEDHYSVNNPDVVNNFFSYSNKIS